ncbi:DUF3572 domain-containing protein [uncultured Agrobacterium sp.]|uniref:DUF3572 domain-containing protein n=1 Tax=uncultured Agrobacterium sp. TaxID=157277 RepID=UPI0025FFC6A8|nr:DUF3572 domain-containing protein [uncultured Agrobacterium sp.]
MQRSMKNGKSMVKDPEETVAAILGWLANEPDILARFLALSGLQPNMLRAAIQDPGFLAGLTDFVMNHEPDLMAFCEASGFNPEDVQAAWHRYSGPGLDSGVY